MQKRFNNIISSLIFFLSLSCAAQNDIPHEEHVYQLDSLDFVKAATIKKMFAGYWNWTYNPESWNFDWKTPAKCHCTKSLHFDADTLRIYNGDTLHYTTAFTIQPYKLGKYSITYYHLVLLKNEEKWQFTFYTDAKSNAKTLVINKDAHCKCGYPEEAYLKMGLKT